MTRTFTDEQLEAINTDADELIIGAGAGTGKTTVIIERALRLARAGNRILLSTFSIMARQEIKDRIREHPEVTNGNVNPNDIVVATSGSIAWQIMSEVCPDFTLLSSAQIMKRFERYADNLGYECNEDMELDIAERQKHKRKYYRQLWNGISLLTVNDVQPDDIEIPESIAPLYNGWYAYLRNEKICDSSSIQQMALDIILDDKAPHQWMSFNEILGDEAQDFSVVQRLTLTNLAKKSHGTLTLVGDAEQAIYSWRGAEPGIIFPRNEPGCHYVALTQNFRSTKQILAPALKIVNTIQGVDKKLVSSRNGPPIEMKVLPHIKKEGDYIAERCLALMEGNIIPLHEIAIMARSHYVLNQVFSALSRKNIPFVYVGNSFFSRPEYKIMRAAVDLLANAEPFEAMTRIVKIYLGKDIQISPEDGLNAYEAARKALSRYPTAKKLISALSVAYERIAVGGHFHNQIDDLIEKMGLFEHARRLPDGIHVLHTLQDFREMSMFYGDYAAFRAGMIERENTEQGQKPVPGHIFVGTPFAAKGKEFRNTFIMGVNEGIFPNNQEDNETTCDYRYDIHRTGGYDEEKRIMFVALTRAKEKCCITWSRKRQVGAQMKAISPSSLMYLTGLHLPM